MQTIKLISGHEMPMLGLGTWDLRGEACKRAVKEALGLGYTHIDTAWMYKNQREIGDALREAGADRSRLFITSKVWRTHLHYDGVMEQIGETLRDLQTPYVDLFLIHWPDEATPREETFRALQKILEEGKARSVGVSNFSVELLDASERISKVPICANQIKYHPGSEQRDVLRWCRARGIAVTAYSPLARGSVLQDSILTRIAKVHGKTPAQVTLRWLVQKGMIVIPKASSRPHLEENMDLFGWALSPEEMAQVDAVA